MQQNNFLLDQSTFDGSYQLRLKIKYLQQDKDKLEISCKQMKQNINLLRQINREISKTNTFTQNSIFSKLQEQNSSLEKSYLRILDQNHLFSCQKLMLQQIIQESQNEYKQILKGYENKIIELRRSIQFKQSCIQTFQQNANYLGNGYEIGNIPPSNVSMIFFNQIDEYKSNIQKLQTKNKELEAQIRTVKQRVKFLQEEKQFVDMMISTKCGYFQFKNRLSQQSLNNRLSAKSLPKQSLKALSLQQEKATQSKCGNTNMKNGDKKSLRMERNQQQKEKSTSQNSNKRQRHLITQPQQTRQVSYQCTTGNYKLNQLKQQLKKKTIQLSKLGAVYRQQKFKRKQNQEKLKLVINSNKFYKDKRQRFHDQLNYYKRATVDLFRIIEKKKVKRNYSVDRQQLQKIILSIKKPHELQVLTNTKRFWRKLQQELNTVVNNKKSISLGFAQPLRIKRSLSCILDYTQLCHDDDKIDKYYQNKDLGLPKKLINQNKQSNPYNNLDDFSRVLQLGANGQIFDDQTLIIKPKVINYAERKKLKAKKGISDANNLTIIRENVL